MKIFKQLKKTNGSTLALVLFMLFMLSVTAIAVITLTGSELSMSVMTSDRSKALLAAKAGAEKAAQVLDTAVAQAQETARVKASKIVQDEIDSFKVLVNGKLMWDIPSGSPFTEIIDTSDISTTKILEQDELDKIYDTEYKYQFYKNIREWYEEQTELGHEWNNVEGQTVNYGGKTIGKFAYAGIPKKNTTAEEFASLDGNDKENTISSIQITSTGEYTSPSRGSIYKRSISAEFSLLTYLNKDNTSDIPVTYGKLTKVRMNKDIKPSILDNKALIAEKNIISVDGTVNVLKGDAVCFGTMPTKDNAIDYNADSYKFGGIVAGITLHDNSGGKTVWTDPSFGSFNKSIMSSLLPIYTELGIDNTLFLTKDHSGSFNFNSNVATAAYVHTLKSFSDEDNKHSDINVSEKTFARSFIVESESNYSNIDLKKGLYTYDDLKIDGNNAEVKIGEWDRDNLDYKPKTNSEGCMVGLNRGSDSNSVSSAVIVAGDSKLFINGSVYVGGSTFYNDYLNNNKPYISGMSIQKSDSRPAEAFEKDANILNTHNYFHYYNNDVPNPGYESIDPYYEHYEKQDLTDSTKKKDTEMMQGTNNTEIFNILIRAMHLKFIWDDEWKSDIGYASYFNTGDVKIEPLNEKGQIKGFCCGGVAANDTIYGPYGGFYVEDGGKTSAEGKASTDGTVNDYSGAAEAGMKEYLKLMDLFINPDEPNDLKLASPTKKLAGNVKASDDSVDTLALSDNGNDFFNTYSSNTFMYYSTSNVVLKNNDVNNHNISGEGIIYTKGDIYVKAGTNFKGILIAEGNIVFLGNANIEYDENVVDNLLLEDQQIGRFFKHTVSDVIMNDPNAIVQTVKKKNVKNIKIISWKEI